MDGVEALDGVVVLGATNRIDVLDSALLRPGRFDEIVRVDKPDAAARHAIFTIHLKDIPTVAIDIDRLVQMTDGFSGADVAAVCRRAAMDAVRHHISSGADADVTVSGAALESAVQSFRQRLQVEG
jgi:transitional endoplasmic reticulum ATPase